MDENSDKILKGKTLFTSKPWAYVLSRDFQQLRCDFCFTSQQKLSRCSSCGFSYYCNKKCQKLAWQYHKEECFCLKKIHPTVPPDFVRLMVRVIYILKKGGRNSREVVGNTTRNFENLMSHENEIKKDTKRRDEFIVFTQVLKDFIGEENLPSSTELLDIYGKLVINCFSICDDEMQPIGTGLYLGASGLDHSCQPNAVVIFQGTTAVVRAVEDVSSLDLNKIRITYIDVMDTISERQEQLQTQYYFQCNCSLCQDKNIDLLKTSIKCRNASCTEPQLILSGKSVHSECPICHSQSPSQKTVCEAWKIITLIQKTLKETKMCQNTNEILAKLGTLLLNSSSLLHNYNVYSIRLKDQIMETHIKDGSWRKAADIGLETLDGYRLYYGKLHPLFGIQLVRIGKLLNYLDDIQLARKYFQEAETVLNVTHSNADPLYKLLEMLMIENKF